MAFDPNKYLAEKTGGFDPNAYLKAKLGTDISPEESALRGAVQGATFGFAPAISGAAQAVPAALNAASGAGSLKDILAAYQKGRDASKTEFDAAQKANPKSSLAGNLVGGLIPAALTGGISEEASAAKGLSGLTGGMLAPATTAGALTGAGYGALSGAGNAVSNGEGLSDAAGDVAENAAGGALLGGALGKASKALGGVPEALDEFGNKAAATATGMGKSQAKAMLRQDAKNGAYASSAGSETPESVIQKMGRLLSEPNGLTEKPVVTAGSTPEDMLDSAQNLSDLSGKSMNSIQTALDSSFNENNPDVISKFFNPTKAMQEIQEQLMPPTFGETGQVAPIDNAKANAVGEILQTVSNYGNTPITFEEAQQLKSQLQNAANYETAGSPKNQLIKRAAGIIGNQIDDAASDVASSGNGLSPDLADKYQKAKDLYGASQQAISGATNKVAGNMVNRAASPSDYISGAAGLVAGGPTGGVISAIGNKIARVYGPSTQAAGAKGLSNVLSSVNKSLVDAPKEVITNFGQQMVNSGGPLETSLGNILIKAADRDDIGRNALIFSLMQNSGYRQLLQKYMGKTDVVK